MTGYVLAVLTFAGLYSLLGLALNLQWGHTGLVNLGYVAFFAVGAYASALLAQRHFSLVLTPFIGAALAAVCAYPLGRLTLHLGEDYFAIVTFGFAEILRVLLYNSQWAGGSAGLYGVPILFGQLSEDWQPVAQLAGIAAAVLVVLLALQLLFESPFGRLLRAIRENELATRSLGKDPTRFKLVALTLGSGIAGFGGAMYAHYIGYLSPDQFDPTLTFTILTGVLLGGNSNIGAAVGTIVLLGATEGTRFLSDLDLPIDPSVLAQVRVLIVGLLLISVIRFRRQGLWPYRIKLRNVEPVATQNMTSSSDSVKG
jgi:branched-chain amino acid transport system permease protein